PGYQRELASAYGTLYLNATSGAYKFVANDAAIEALEAGQAPSAIFSVTASANGAASAPSALTLDIFGANDRPVATGTYTHTVTDTSVLDAFGTNLTGTLAASDRDTGDTLTWSGTAAGTYGTLTVNANGTYGYAINALAVNAVQAGQTPSDTFTVTVTDAGGLTDTRAITINVAGANDRPVATGTYTHSVTDTPVLDAFGTKLTGTLAAADRDTGDRLAWSGAAAGTYGTLTVNADGTYSYAINAMAVNALQAGQTPSDTFTVTVTDAGGLSDTRTITINVAGANDTPVATGTYTHRVADTGALNTFANLTGTLAATDRDTGDTLAWSGGAAGTYGTLTVNADGSYSYAVNAAAVNALQAGFAASDTFTVTATDARGAADLRTVVISLSGADELLTSPPTVNALTTTETSPIITGTLDPDAVALEVTIDGATYRLGADAALTVRGGQWFLSLAVAGKSLAFGVYEVSVHARDANGNGATDRSSVELVVAAPRQDAPSQEAATGTDQTTTTQAAGDQSGSGLSPIGEQFSRLPLRLPVDQGVPASDVAGSITGGSGGASGESQGSGPLAAQDLNALPATGAGAPDRNGFPLVRMTPQEAGTRVGEVDQQTKLSDSGHRLFVYHGIPNMRLQPDGTGQLRVPQDAFAHTDPGAIVILDARLANGSPLPAWLKFEGMRGVFVGVPPDNVRGTIQIEVVARDSAGREARTVFQLRIEELRTEEAPAQPGRVSVDETEQREGADAVLGLEVDKQEAEKARSEAKRAGTESPDGTAKAKPAARPQKQGALPFSEQIRAARTAQDPLVERIARAAEEPPRRAP
ncbi:MAG: VCBS domain-containing protein, partial [Betaproteobacteria bacterium]